MSSKISALLSSGNVENGDDFVLARGAGNKKCGRTFFLTAISTEDIGFTHDSGSLVALKPNGHVWITTGSGGIFILSNSTSSFVVSLSDTNCAFDFTGAGFVRFQNNAGTLQIDATGQVNLFASPGNVVAIQYVPTFPASWGAPATDVWLALDRLAAAVAGLLGFPVP